MTSFKKILYTRIIRKSIIFRNTGLAATERKLVQKALISLLNLLCVVDQLYLNDLFSQLWKNTGL